MIRMMILALAMSGAVSAGAQEPIGDATVDSANVARAAWRRANVAMQAGDIATARAAVDRAAQAWPTQEAYVWGRAALAARAGDTLALGSALTAYADLGLGRDLATEPSTASFAALAPFAPIRERHRANLAPLANSRMLATLPDSTFWPEGVDHDPSTGAYYVGSVRHRTIAEWRPGAGSAAPRTRELISRGMKGVGAILGVRVDAARGVVWATTAGLPQMEGFTAADTLLAALLEIRISDGSVLRRFDLPPSPNGHVLGDLAIGPRGDVFVTDSRDPVLYRLAPGADALVPLRHALFRSLQGIAPTPDGRAVYVADWSHGILRVDVATGEVIRLADAPNSVSLGCDGIAWDRGAIVAVQNGVVPARVMRFTLAADGRRFTRADVLDRHATMADEPTIGTIVGSEFVYVANSQWEKYDDAGARNPARPLKRPILLAVPLPR